MMNLPIKLREHTGSCVPKGPTFASARRVHFSIEGTNIEFYAPWHRPRSRTTKALMPERKNKLKDLIFQSDFDKYFHLTDSWEYSNLFYRRWAFNGPWFTGPLAELRMALGLIRPKTLNANVSYFHPRAFEQAVGDYLTNRYAIHKLDGRSMWIIPYNWQPLEHLPVVAARLQAKPDEAVTLLKSTFDYVFFPVTDQCLAVMFFDPARLEGRGSEAEREKFISKATMVKLMEGIIGSLKLTLSPEAEARRDQALQSLDDTALIKHFPPMKWTTAEEDALWAAKHPEKPPLDKVLKTG